MTIERKQDYSVTKLQIIIDIDYPPDLDLTSYEDCDNILEAANLDKELLEDGEIDLTDFIGSPRTSISYQIVLGDEQ